MIWFLQNTLLPMGYMESLNLYQHTHSRELLDTIAAGRPLALYQLLEKDLAKAMNSWTLTDWKTCIIALDNNQVKKSSYNAKHKAKTVSLGELRIFQCEEFCNRPWAPKLFAECRRRWLFCPGNMLISLVSIKQISLWTQGIVLLFKQIFGDKHLEKITLRPLSEGLIRLLKDRPSDWL